MVILPELPKLETPVRRLTDPDTPDDPEFWDRTITTPELLLVPAPELKSKLPPVARAETPVATAGAL